MDVIVSNCTKFQVSEIQMFLPQAIRWTSGVKAPEASTLSFKARSAAKVYNKKVPKNIRYPRRSKLPPDPGVNIFLKNRGTDVVPNNIDLLYSGRPDLTAGGHKKEEDKGAGKLDGDDDLEEVKDDGAWGPDEIEAITSLFQGRIPQKPGKLNRIRPLPLPLPHKLRPVGLPLPKRQARGASPLGFSSWSCQNQVYKNPDFLIGLAREIRGLPKDEDVFSYLNKWASFLRKGSLSLTIRELGHMHLPERALQVFCWAQKQPQLFPDDRVLASTVEVLARSRELKVPFNLQRLTSLSSLSVIEAMMRGFIKGGSLDIAWKLLMVAKDGKRVLDPSIYAKLILELGKNPDKDVYVLALLNELGERDDLKLSQQDCTAVMKVCRLLGKYDIVESLFDWFKQSGHDPGVVMYTTVIHSRYSAKMYREALALVWEMESLNCLFDLPAYRVVIKLFVALNDLPRTVRYFSKLKESGFATTYDIYQHVINIYIASGRLAKCMEVCKEAEMAGFKLDKQTELQMRRLETEIRSGV